VRWFSRPRWQDLDSQFDSTFEFRAGRIEVPAGKLSADLQKYPRLLWRMVGTTARDSRLLLTVESSRSTPNSVRLSPDDLVAMTSWRKGEEAPRLQVAAPTAWASLRALPGPSVSLAVSTLLTALLVAAPLVTGSPKPAQQSAAAAAVEVDKVEQDITRLTDLAARLQPAPASRPLGTEDGEDDQRQTSKELIEAAERIAVWEEGLDERALTPGGAPTLLDVGTKLATLITAALSFVVAYRGLRPGA
jgi:hypothetical protein